MIFRVQDKFGIAYQIKEQGTDIGHILGSPMSKVVQKFLGGYDVSYSQIWINILIYIQIKSILRLMSNITGSIKNLPTFSRIQSMDKELTISARKIEKMAVNKIVSKKKFIL